jgi:heme/copper-type cytochrome/quinol oxidase subunit 3
MSGPDSQAWWAVVVLMLVSASIYGCALFSYLYLWTVSPEVWPSALPDTGSPLASAALLVLASAAFGAANVFLKKNSRGTVSACLILGMALLSAGVGLEFASHSALSPTESAYGAAVYLILVLAGFYACVAIAMTLFVLARAASGMVDAVRRVTFDNARLFWHYTVAQTLVGLVLVHGFPRLVA